MKRRDIYTFRKGLNLVRFSKPKPTYAVAKNKRLVETEISDMEKAIEPTEKYREYQKKKTELDIKHAKKENNKPKLYEKKNLFTGKTDFFYDIVGKSDPNGKYNKELAKLEDTFREEIKKQEEKEEQYNTDFLEQETDFAPYMIGLEELEGEKCDQEIMDCLIYMIKE